jgi:dTDP-glucose pyrophosphorylase
MNSIIDNMTINADSSIFSALKKMDLLGKKSLLVLENDLFLSILSIGDIQRAIIKNYSLELSIKNILRENILVANEHDSYEKIKEMMFNYRMEFCPIIDINNKIIKIVFWEDIFKSEYIKPINKFNVPVIIMAGGIGSRLKPLTNILPKPLLPINSKTIIEEIFDRFAKFGCENFYISVNYKSEMIEYYLQNLDLSYNLIYFKEDFPMGTAGSLSLLKDKINETFFVTNCDILIDQDYFEILCFHKEMKNEITIVAALKNYSIPYGTIESGENGELISIKEKPDLTFKINSGMYILESHLINEIPKYQIFHITDLIEKVKERKGNIGVFPVNSNSWKDIGNWEDYSKYIFK